MKVNNWKDIKEKGLFRYILIDSIVTRMIPLGVILFLIFNILNILNYGFESINFNSLLIEIFVVLIIFSILGFLFGILNWKYNENFSNLNKDEIKTGFILINGILGWGIPIFIIDFLSRDELSISFFFISLIIWVLVGYFFGKFLFSGIKDNLGD